MSKIFKTILCALFLFGLTSNTYADEYKKGDDYLVLPTSVSEKIPTLKDKVTVVEFFSFGCPACYRLEPALIKWLQTKPSYVAFYRVPAIFQPSWKTYAQAYYIGEELNVGHKINDALFKAIQNDHLDLTTPDAMANFFATQGVSKEKFMALYNTPTTDLRLSEGQDMMNNALIFQIPTVLIDGTYRVDPSLTGNDPNQLIDVINYLIKKQASEKKLITQVVVAEQKGDQMSTAKSG
jgi:protein dithiol oxidoreductase (disulfide-forming)